MNINLANPSFLLLILLLPLVWLLYRKKVARKVSTLRYSNLGMLRRAQKKPAAGFRRFLPVLRLLGLLLFILGMSRPQSSSVLKDTITEGVDIMMVLDISSSMLAQDFKPDRLEAAKKVASTFIDHRTNDRTGLVIFAAESFTQCPLTLDYGVLKELMVEIKIADKEYDGTAIGMALINAVNRLKDSKAKSKVIILLTDGENNAGAVDPITASQVAQALKIKIYTIGAGTRGTAMYPVDDPLFGRSYMRVPAKIDEKMLQKVADNTGGRYFRATDNKNLDKIYKEINELEQTKIKTLEFTRYEELYLWLLIPGLILVLGEIVLSQTKYRKIP